MTNRIGTAPHPTSGETYAVETLGLERADGVTIIRAAGPLTADAPQDPQAILAMLDDARTNGTDQDDGNWLQEAWGDRNVRFTAVSIRINTRTKLGWAYSTQPSGDGPYGIVPPDKPRIAGTARTIARKRQEDPVYRSLEGAGRSERWFHAGRPLMSLWPVRLEDLLEIQGEVLADYDPE